MLLKNIPQKTLLIAAGASSIASFAGSLPYFKQEIDNLPMAVTAVGVLTLAIASGWDIALNNKNPRIKIIAATIAISASLISSFTIYQKIIQPKINEQQQTLATEKAKAQKNRAEQITLNKNDIDHLKNLNSADRQQKKSFEYKLSKHPRFKTTRVSLRDSITKLSADIIRREKLIEARQQNLNRIFALGVNISAPKKPTKELNIPTLARASIYDAMTFLLLLMAGFYKRETTDKLSEEVKAANNAKSALKTAVTVAKKQTVAIKKATKTNCDLTVDLTVENFLDMLHQKQIKESTRGFITPKEVSKHIKKGIPTAKEYLRDAYHAGAIQGIETKRGMNYKYFIETPSEARKQEEQLEFKGLHLVKATVSGG